jgi:hypothetical protein
MRGTPSDTRQRLYHARAIALAVTCGALAIAACGSSSKSTPRAGSNPVAASLMFAACMRSQGVPDFPDPGSDGLSSTNGRVDKQSPAFRTALEACNVGQPALAEAKPRPSQARQLRQAECMRAHGVTSYPDPLPGGGFSVPSTINPQSPTFLAASNACEKT